MRKAKALPLQYFSPTISLMIYLNCCSGYRLLQNEVRPARVFADFRSLSAQNPFLSGGILMTTTDAYILSCYQEIAVLNPQHGITLVQHTASGTVYVKKILETYNADVYEYLYNHHVKGTPEIVEIAEQDGRLIVIEEYISGQTLRAILDNGNIFTEDTAVTIVEELCRILLELHSADPPILHRDIKPSNIIRTADGSIRLLDMNAARQADPLKKEDTELIGTVGYAAPEQYGFGASSVQTDIYAVGVLLNELVTGVLPKDRMPRGRLGKIVKKCTRIDPKDRYRSVKELMSALASCRSHPDDYEHNIYRNSFLPPGFRSKKPANMLIAIFIYAFAFYICIDFTAESIEPGIETWIERIILSFFTLLMMLFTGNYLDIWSFMGISRIRNAWLRFLAVLAFDALLAAIMLVIMIFAALIMGAYHFVS